MKKLGIFIFLIFSAMSTMAQIKISNQHYFERFNSFDTLSYNFKALSDKLSNVKEYSFFLDLKSFGRFEISISPSQLILDESEVFAVAGNQKIRISVHKDVNHWQGFVKKTNRIVRLNIYKNKLSGMIDTDSGFIYVETITISRINKLIVYKSEKQSELNLKPICGTEPTKSLYKKTTEKSNALIAYDDFTCSIAKIASVSTYKLFKKNKFDTLATFNENRDIFNLTDGIYAKYIGIRLKIVSEAISLDSLLEYNTSSGTDKRISSFLANRQKFKGNISPDIYHLFMEYFDPSDGASGRGYIGSICDNYNASVSMKDGSLGRNVLILAHEFGHNFNANHSDGSGCGAANASIMCPSGYSGNPSFFNFNETKVIKAFIASKLSNSHPDYCLSYPIEVDGTDLCDKDSGIITVSRIGDYSIDFYYENTLVKPAIGDLNIGIKKAGRYTFLFKTDTVNALSCSFSKDVYVANRNFKVTSTNENILGSLKYAILNANTCKGLDTITFNLPDKINEIKVSTVLPPLIEDCIIDGTSQPNFSYPQNDKVFRPGVRIISNLPSATYSKHGLLLGKNRYTIKGLEINGFESAITNDVYSFRNSVYSHLEPSIEGNFFMESIITSCKFIGNGRGIYLQMYDTTKNNDRIVIGKGSLQTANFFIGSKSNSCRIVYTENVSVNNNYYGVEPLIDTISSIASGIVVNQCKNVEILNNSICSSIYEAIGSISSSGKVQNNSIGLNPFNNNITGYSGVGISASNSNSTTPLLIGGLGASEGNILYNQKKVNKIDAAYSNYGDKGVIFIGNKSINPDTSSILFYYSKPVKSLILDSSILNCTTNQATVYGKITHKFLNDTLSLHFYSIPSGVKIGFEPIHNYLGAKTIITTDTNEMVFSQILNNCNINEGIVFTATSQKMNLTSQLSNVIYFKNGSQLQFSNLRDTIICPGKSVNVTFKANYKDYKINGQSVASSSVINAPGFYQSTAKDANGCSYQQANIIKQHPNFLKSAYIQTKDFYSFDSIYQVKLADYYDQRKWFTYLWTATNGFIDTDKKMETIVAFNKESGSINYQITDVNKCTYSISKTLLHKLDAKEIRKHTVVSIFPNPSINGIFNIVSESPETMYLYNSIGSLVLKINKASKNSQIDLSHYQKGLYMLYIENYGYYKLIKN